MERTSLSSSFLASVREEKISWITFAFSFLGFFSFLLSPARLFHSFINEEWDNFFPVITSINSLFKRILRFTLRFYDTRYNCFSWFTEFWITLEWNWRKIIECSNITFMVSPNILNSFNICKKKTYANNLPILVRYFYKIIQWFFVSTWNSEKEKIFNNRTKIAELYWVRMFLATFK